MEWMKKHVDTVVILGAFASSILWINGKFDDVNDRFAGVEKDMSLLRAGVEKDMSLLRTDMAVIKTVLIMKEVMPKELAKGE